MKTVGVEKATLDECVKNARLERVVVTRNGKPVALIVGIEGMDEEQPRLSSSGKFWTFISERRKQRTVSRQQLEQMISKGTPAKRRL